jgi:sulfofructose kinase
LFLSLTGKKPASYSFYDSNNIIIAVMNSAREWDLIGFGAIAVDDLLYVPTYPHPNSKIEVSKRERQGGGLAGTALVAASRLGARSAYFGMLGQNDLSDFTIREFTSEGVDTSLCPRNETAQPIYSSIIVDKSTSERTILYSLENFTPPDPAIIPIHLPKNYKLMFVDTYFLPILDYLVKISHACETPVIADIEDSRLKEYPDVINAIEYLILSVELAAQISMSSSPQEILYKLDSLQRRCTVITEGNQGCWFRERDGGIYHMPAFKVNAVDTTGCGDVFHGAYAAAIVRGETNTTSVIQASAAAAMKATKPGGRAGIPYLSELLDFIKANPDIVPQKVE